MKPLMISEIKQLLRATLVNMPPKGVITGVSIDSRTCAAGDLFIAIPGENFDGHDYIDQAVVAKCAAIVAEKPPANVSELNACVMVVDNSIEALGKIAKFYRRTLGYAVSVIGVTGSCGKTTTRSMIYHVLSQFKQGYQSPKNYNNNIGVPLTLLSVKRDDDFVVVEMGSNNPGEIATLSQIVEPDLAVITSVGPSHLEGLVSIGGVIDEKASITAGMSESGQVFCFDDDGPLIEKMRGLVQPAVSFSLEDRSDIYAKDIKRIAKGMRYVTNDNVTVALHIDGRHNIANSLAALCVARRLGISSDEFSNAIATYVPPPGRMQRIKLDDIVLIDDTYNANPASVRAAVDTLSAMRQANRRILVLGDMNELGEGSHQYHKALGQYIASLGNIELLFTVGAKAAVIANEAINSGMRIGSVQRCVSSQRLARLIKTHIHNDDYILVKGSRAMEMEKVIVSLKRFKGQEPVNKTRKVHLDTIDVEKAIKKRKVSR